MRAALLLLSVLMIASCGVKPSHVDSPAGKEGDTFPRTYPDPSTDGEF